MVFASPQLGLLKRYLVDDDSVACKLGNFRVTLARIQQRLAWNTTDIQTGAAQRRAFLDESDFQFELRGAQGTRIAAGSAADNEHVKGVRHFLLVLHWIHTSN